MNVSGPYIKLKFAVQFQGPVHLELFCPVLPFSFLVKTKSVISLGTERLKCEKGNIWNSNTELLPYFCLTRLPASNDNWFLGANKTT